MAGSTNGYARLPSGASLPGAISTQQESIYPIKEVAHFQGCNAWVLERTSSTWAPHFG